MGTATLTERPAETAAAPKLKTGYLATIDAARVLAAIGIIWVHAAIDLDLPGATAPAMPDAADVRTPDTDTGALGRFRVPFFTLVAAYFAFTGAFRHPDETFGQYFVTRLNRLYRPFLAWSLIYIALKYLQARTLGRPEVISWRWAFLWNGGSYHLWFLPFIFASTLAVFAVARLLQRSPYNARVFASATAALGLCLCLVPIDERWYYAHNDMALLYSRYALPSVVWGITLGCFYGLGKGEEYRGTGVAVLGLVVLFLCSAALTRVYRHPLFENLSGVGLVLFAFSHIRHKAIDFLARFGYLTLGIYLSHVLFVGACRVFAGKLHFERTVWFALFATVVSLACSATLTWLLLKSRWTRWLVT